MFKRIVFFALLVQFAAPMAWAQSTYPNRPTKILVGFTPGTVADVVARILADRFAEVWGTPFVIEIITGASSNIATDHVAKAAADGYTLLMGGNSRRWSSIRACTKRCRSTRSGISRRSRRCSSRRTCSRFRLRCRSRPWRNWWRSPKRSPASFPMVMPASARRSIWAPNCSNTWRMSTLQPVAYRGTTALMPDLLANRVTMSFANIVNVMPLAREGKLRALAITSIKRSSLAPDLPTMAESGFPGFEAVPWFGLLAPAGTPKDVLDKLHDETVKALAMPEVRRKFDQLGPPAGR